MGPARGRTAPLVVDVDGSLVAGDLLIEGVLRLVAARPLALFALPFWLAAGRAALKQARAERLQRVIDELRRTGRGR